MKLDLNKFYNSNYRDFVHKEAVEEALKLVPEVELKDVEVDNILSITFSVDEYGENPMYIEYIDKESKKHLVRIRPAVSNEIQEMLKRYVTLEQHESDKNAIYNHFERLNVPLELRSENGLDEDGNREVVLNNDNSFISFQVDPENDDEIQWLCIHNKGGLGTQTQYFVRFVDFAKVDEVPSNADFAEKVRQLEEKMNTADNRVLEASKDYTDSTITSLGDELNVKIEQTKNELSVLIEEKTQDTLQQVKDYADTKDTEYLETSKRYTNNAKQEAIDESKAYTDSETDKTLDESKTYTDTKHSEVTQNLAELQDDVNTNYATKQELLINVEGLNDYVNTNVQNLNDKIGTKATVYTATEGQQTISRYNEVTFEKMLSGDITFKAGRKAQAYGYLLNESQLTKLKNLNETPTGNLCDIKYNTVEDATEINFIPGNPNRVLVKTDNGIMMNSSFITPDQATKITNAENKLSEISDVATNITWDPSPNLHYIRLLDNDKYVKAHMNKDLAQSEEVITYLPKENLGEKIDTINSNKADKQTVDGLSQLVQEIATKVDGVEIGERTKLNFALSNSNTENPINPRITSNDSYYVKVGSQYIISVYLTVEIEVIPTTTQKNVSFAWMHDLPGENPPLTLTAELIGNKTNYSTTRMITTNRNRVSFSIPAFPTTETYIGNEISIYGAGITKDLSKEAENNE